MLSLRKLAVYLGALGIVIFALLFVLKTTSPSFPSLPSTMETSGTAQTASVSSAELDQETDAPPSISQTSNLPPEDEFATASRIKDPYPFPPQSFDVIHQQTRAALVNIFCVAESQGILPISGSGVIIDARGVILTNAHVAQYLLLAESGQTNISCSIRWGSPARVAWNAEVLYIPPIWVHENASDIRLPHPTGTGEHDYALLRITARADGTPNTQAHPSLPFDTREGIGFPGDTALVASYPAEFIGPTGTLFGLHPISSTAPIKEVLTFSKNSVDLISLGGVLGAQGGSSGGPIVNAWGRVIGVITTTSTGITTDERELRALTLSYISRDMEEQSRLSLDAMLSGDLAERARDFRSVHSTTLVRTLLEQLSSSSQ